MKGERYYCILSFLIFLTRNIPRVCYFPALQFTLLRKVSNSLFSKFLITVTNLGKLLQKITICKKWFFTAQYCHVDKLVSRSYIPNLVYNWICQLHFVLKTAKVTWAFTIAIFELVFDIFYQLNTLFGTQISQMQPTDTIASSVVSYTLQLWINFVYQKQARRL